MVHSPSPKYEVNKKICSVMSSIQECSVGIVEKILARTSAIVPAAINQEQTTRSTKTRATSRLRHHEGRESSARRPRYDLRQKQQ